MKKTKCDVIRLRFDKGTDAHTCIECGFSYRTYCDYLSQFNYDGQRMVPISQDKYMQVALMHEMGKIV